MHSRVGGLDRRRRRRRDLVYFEKKERELTSVWATYEEVV